ncbi:MAG: saccharopine dehydrogenase C-terminal domain-containing protein [Deltaproteobacteria bacterium]|nr:saccharopine dehydrogenase C-terminal domain-containing protein [Deltaproteobacteria bacterium]
MTKKILVLGAGLVSRPLVHYLTGREGLEVTVATRTVAKAEALVAGRGRGKALSLDVNDMAALERQVAAHDISVSLLPATEHVRVARLCLAHDRHMATTSYISPEMRALDGEAKARGLSFVNECGVDPGIDHMSAMRVINGAKAKGGKVVAFRSYCGGLPAPEANTNPIGYKFSWAPRGVLVAAMNPARYLKDGELVEIPGSELFAAPEMVEVKGAGRFEGYPNRDSLGYIDMYGLKGVRTMFRGTLRNLGHCETWYRWVKLGLFAREPRTDLKGLTRAGFMRTFADGKKGDLKQAIAARMGVAADAPAVAKLAWLGMFDETPLPSPDGGNVDVMAAAMLEKCAFAPGERDMLVMQHEFAIEYAGGRSEKVFSSLVDYGIPNGDSSMARTVSLPVAIATRMILGGEIRERGVIAPVMPAVYEPILKELETMGITFEERTA